MFPIYWSDDMREYDFRTAKSCLIDDVRHEHQFVDEIRHYENYLWCAPLPECFGRNRVARGPGNHCCRSKSLHVFLSTSSGNKALGMASPAPRHPIDLPSTFPATFRKGQNNVLRGLLSTAT